MTRFWDLDYHQYHDGWIEYIDGELAKRDADTTYNMSCTITAQLHRTDLPPGSHDLIYECQELVGGLEFHQLRGVYLPSGNVVRPHAHESMVVVLYMPHTHDSAKLAFANPNEEFDTVAGRAVEIAQARNHWVTRNHGKRRITMAVMFTAPN